MGNEHTFMESALSKALHTLTENKVSGTMVVKSGGESARFVLHEGRILSASASGVPKLGRSLVERGWLSEKVLKNALVLQARKKVRQPLGSLLAALELVPHQIVQGAVAEQIQRCLAFASGWTEGCVFFNYQEIDVDGVVQPTAVYARVFLMHHAVTLASGRVDDLFGGFADIDAAQN